MVQLVYDSPWWSENAAALALRDAKPIGSLRSGHPLFLERQKRDLFFIVSDPEEGQPIAYLELEKFPGPNRSSWQEHHVTASPSVRGTPVILDLYRHLILERGILLISDDIQTPGGRSIWARLAAEHDILLSAWDGASLFAVDEDLDSSLEIYIDSREDVLLRESEQKIRAKLRAIRLALESEAIRPYRKKSLRDRQRSLRESLSISRSEIAEAAARDESILLIAAPAEGAVAFDLSAWA